MDSHGGLNNLDYIVLGIVLLSGLLAMMRGFTREMFSLLAWIGATFAATKFYPLATPQMHHYVKNDKAAEWAAMAAVFFVSLILLMIVGSIVASFIKGRALTAIDRSLGFLYGLLRGGLVVSLVYLGAVMMFWPDIDQPQAAPSGQTVTVAVEQPPTEQKTQEQDRNVPPDLVMQARTRPLMAFGAEKLKAFIPRDMIDKSLKGMEAHKADAEKAAAQKALDRLSTPAPPHAASEGGLMDANRIEGSQP